MRMKIDESGADGESSRIHDLSGLALQAANGDDLSSHSRNVRAICRSSGAIKDTTVLDLEVIHRLALHAKAFFDAADITANPYQGATVL